MLRKAIAASAAIRVGGGDPVRSAGEGVILVLGLKYSDRNCDPW